MSPERPRIGYVVSQFPCYDETFILREIRALAAKDVPLVIFSLRRRPQAVVQEDAEAFLSATRYCGFLSRDALIALARALVRTPLPLLRLAVALTRDLWRRPLTLLKSLAFIPKTLRFGELARREGVARLHAHWASHPATAAMLISRLTGIPWSLTCHAHDIFFDPILLPEKLADAAFTLTCTAYNQRYLESLGPSLSGRVRVGYHGLDLELFRPPGARSPAPALRILAVGSLLACKGFPDLIEACRILHDRGCAIRLTLAGGGPDEASLRRQAARAGIADRVRFTGFVTQRELVPLYQEADLFVLPAVVEIHWGIPNVLVEAFACALPVVTSPLPSIGELVEDGRSGLIVPDRNPAALADAIRFLAGDPARREEMGRRGRKRVEELFDIHRTIESVIEPLVGQGSHAVPRS